MPKLKQLKITRINKRTYSPYLLVSLNLITFEHTKINSLNARIYCSDHMMISRWKECVSSLLGKTIQSRIISSSWTVTLLPRIQAVGRLKPCAVASSFSSFSNPPSIRAQLPILESHPITECMIHESFLISTESRIIASLIRAPRPIRTRGPIETLGPIRAVGWMTAVEWM
jgi:hypothetical protein